jgi:hypothetical protein
MPELIDDQGEVNLVPTETFQQMRAGALPRDGRGLGQQILDDGGARQREVGPCLLYTSDAADDIL